MSFIDVVLSPPEIDLLPERDLSSSIAVVFDVLRATSTMITALANGAAGIRPVSTIEEALELRAWQPALLLGGERFGERIDGFDLGNSPLEYGGNVQGREIVSTTTNGTVALRAVEHGETVLAAALLNAEATAEYLNSRPDSPILLVCAGTFREAALEDIFGAGLLASLLPGRELSDSALAALAIYDEGKKQPAGILHRAKNGRALIAKGRAAEVEWCARASTINLVAQMKPDGFVRLRHST